MALGSRDMDDENLDNSSTLRHRLVNSLSNSYPGSILTNAVNTSNTDVDANITEDPLSKSCFSHLNLEKIKLKAQEVDDDLTNLNWLCDADLLKNLDTGDRSLCTSPIDDQKENGDYYNSYSRQHPPHVPYNPLKHTNSKPPYSFSCLIFMSIEDSVHKKLPVKDIYNWILTHFPYFQKAPTGWKNSVRHNLSLNKCFMKVDKDRGQSIGKGSLWCIDPDYRPNLLQALRKTPYHPYHQLQMLANPPPHTYTILPKMTGITNSPVKQDNINAPSPELFPFLSRRMALSKSDTASDIDVANTLVSLKSISKMKQLGINWSGDEGHDSSRSPSPPEFGSERDRLQLKKRKRPLTKRSSSPIVIVDAPSIDHVYCVTSAPDADSEGSSIDGEYEFEEKELLSSPVKKRPALAKNPLVVKLPRIGSIEIKQELDGECESDMSDMEEELQLREQHRMAQEHYRREMRARAVKARLRPNNVDEEELRIVEGADALLNLAGISTNMAMKNNQKGRNITKRQWSKNCKTDIVNNNNVEKITSSQPSTADLLASVDKGLPLIQKIKEEKEDVEYEEATDSQTDINLEICFQIKQEPTTEEEPTATSPKKILPAKKSSKNKILKNNLSKKTSKKSKKALVKKGLNHNINSESIAKGRSRRENAGKNRKRDL